MVFPN